MTTATDSPQPSVEVRIRGRPWGALIVVTLLLSITTALGLGASDLVGTLKSNPETTMFTLLVGVVIWSLAMALFFYFTVSEVRISTLGLSFRVGGAWRVASWEEILPPRYPLSFGTIPIEWGPNGESHVNVSRRLALAIITNGSHPKWSLPPLVCASLGIAPG